MQNILEAYRYEGYDETGLKAVFYGVSPVSGEYNELQWESFPVEFQNNSDVNVIDNITSNEEVFKASQNFMLMWDQGKISLLSDGIPRNIADNVLNIIRIGTPNNIVTENSHTRTVNLKVLEFYPDHEPREDDEYYKFFNKTRKAMKKANKLKCYICGANHTDTQIELHHNIIEYSLTNGIDVDKFKKLHPEYNINTTDDFLRFCQQEGNLLPLCVKHHRSSGGIHCMTYPQWIAQRYWKDDLTLPGVAIKAFGEVVFLSSSQ